MSRLIVVSNRVSAPRDKGASSMGGLAMALGAMLREGRGVWFGWSGETVEHVTGQPRVEQVGGITVALTDLEPQDVEEYYNGYANKTLWPLFHYRIDLTQYDRAFGMGYERVNRRFAEMLAPLIQPDDLIWVHDYHLFPLGRDLRRLGIANRIGFFLHIPWPARQILATLPHRRRLVESMFDYDLIGFQTEEWADAFRDYVVTEEAGVLGEAGRIEAFGKTTRAMAFPIGIDAEAFRAAVESPAAGRAYDRIVASVAFRSLIVGVDRLDYSKGLEERLEGFEQFLADHPELHR